MKRITSLDFIRASWKTERLVAGIFAVDRIIRVDTVEILTIHGKTFFVTFFLIGWGEKISYVIVVVEL